MSRARQNLPAEEELEKTEVNEVLNHKNVWSETPFSLHSPLLSKQPEDKTRSWMWPILCGASVGANARLKESFTLKNSEARGFSGQHTCSFFKSHRMSIIIFRHNNRSSEKSSIKPTVDWGGLYTKIMKNSCFPPFSTLSKQISKEENKDLEHLKLFLYNTAKPAPHPVITGSFREV